MKPTTKAELEELIMGALNETPITCGTVTKVLNNAGIDVRRSAVDKALHRLMEQGKAFYIVAEVERNGFMVKGKHWYDNEMFAKSKQPLDPFAGIVS